MLKRRRSMMAFVLLVATFSPVASRASAGIVRINVLSDRADLISGGDALVSVDLPVGVDPATIRTDVDGRDVTAEFALRPNGLFEGVVTGLADGRNVLTARLPDGSGATLTITNHPSGGPVFGGPQVQPWSCLPGAIDAQCDRPIAYSYTYVSTDPSKSGYQAYDPNNPPTDVATTTTDQGATVPYIVRTETGSVDRGQYQIALLYDPSKPWEPWEPQAGWNHKLEIGGGSSCGTQHGEGVTPAVSDAKALARGFAVASTSLDDNGQNCNLVVQAESLMMMKEHLVETYGAIRYTIGTGCSGGSIVQQQVANSYPGIYDGITPCASFPDSWSTLGNEVEDCALLLGYFDDPTKWQTGVAWDPRAQAAVIGQQSVASCHSWITAGKYDKLFTPRPRTSCAVPAGQAYDAQANPHGARCTLQDYMVSVLGTRAQDGYANSPRDNVGVQYGLAALRSGTISTSQFVDLNAKIGSNNLDNSWQPSRAEADLAGLENVYRSGGVNEGTGMDTVPILDLRGQDSVEIHEDFRSWMMRSRLDHELGGHDNQVIWTGALPLEADATDVDFLTEGFLAMDQWLSAIEADHTSAPLAVKIVKDKPSSVYDHCTDGAGTELPQDVCQRVIPFYQDPRIVAGAPASDDVMKCQLKPLHPSDYYPVRFNDAEWAQLQQIFPSGVCDFSKPGVGQQPTIPWLTYQEGPGGQPLGAAPHSTLIP